MLLVLVFQFGIGSRSNQKGSKPTGTAKLLETEINIT
jgi:hypothetical protein